MSYFRRKIQVLESVMGRLQGKDWGGITTEREVRFILSKLPNPDVVVDVGGNVGNWTAALLKYSKPKQIYVLEPSKKNQKILADRFRQNQHVAIIPKALSDKDGAAPLFADESGSALASLHQRRLDHLGIRHDEVEQVEMMSTARFLSSYGINQIDILKLDIEGHEFSVLKAVPEDYWGKIGAIQFEFGGCNIDSRTFFRDFWYLLSPRFAFFRMSPLGLWPIPRYCVSEEAFTYMNYLCLNRNFESPVPALK